jgi:hypothetical protein
MRVPALLPAGVLGAALTAASPCAAWRLSKEVIRPALVAARSDVRRCAFEHQLPDGRYVMWIVVDARGRGKAELREAPAGSSKSGRHCVEAAYEAPIYPTAMQATVSWSSASPPRPTYSIALPFELSVRSYGFGSEGDPLATGALDGRALRPAPARALPIARMRKRL